MAFANASGEQYNNPVAEKLLKDAIYNCNTPLFEKNVKWLATFDHSSPSVQQSCFQYLDSLSSSLNAIYEAELSLLAQEENVIMHGNGKPLSNYEGQLGLRIVYWKLLDKTYSTQIFMDNLSHESLPHLLFGYNLLNSPPILQSSKINWALENTLTPIPTTMELVFDDINLIIPEQGVKPLLDLLHVHDITIPWPVQNYSHMLGLPSKSTVNYKFINKNQAIQLTGFDVSARSLRHVPFHHPKQIRGILAIVRQYLLLQLILENIKSADLAETAASSSLHLSLYFKEHPIVHAQYQEINKLNNSEQIIIVLSVLSDGRLNVDYMSSGGKELSKQQSHVFQKLIQQTCNIGLAIEVFIKKVVN